MFFSSGIYKLLDIENTAEGFLEKLDNKGITFINLNFAKIIIFTAALLQIVSPSLIIYASLNPNKFKMLGIYSSLSLVIFTVFATLLYHFPPYGAIYYPFISNVTTAGALLLISYNFYKIN